MKTIHIGVQHIRETNTDHLCWEIASMAFKEGDSVEDFANRITRLANNLRTLVDRVTEAKVVKMLQVISEFLWQVAISLETLLDHNTITVEVTG